VQDGVIALDSGLLLFGVYVVRAMAEDAAAASGAAGSAAAGGAVASG
jgi:hypothetical protein